MPLCSCQPFLQGRRPQSNRRNSRGMPKNSCDAGEMRSAFTGTMMVQPAEARAGLYSRSCRAGERLFGGRIVALAIGFRALFKARMRGLVAALPPVDGRGTRGRRHRKPQGTHQHQRRTATEPQQCERHQRDQQPVAFIAPCLAAARCGRRAHRLQRGRCDAERGEIGVVGRSRCVTSAAGRGQRAQR